MSVQWDHRVSKGLERSMKAAHSDGSMQALSFLPGAVLGYCFPQKHSVTIAMVYAVSPWSIGLKIVEETPLEQANDKKTGPRPGDLSPSPLLPSPRLPKTFHMLAPAS